MTETSNTPALQMEGVRKTYKVGDEEVVALDHADLTVGSDEIVALVGPSGSGKTTLCSIAGGILSPAGGIANNVSGSRRPIPYRVAITISS